MTQDHRTPGAPPTEPQGAGAPPFGLPQAAGVLRTTEGAVCKACGYSLSGLSAEGSCPECGLSIERSLTDDMLVNSSPEYVARLKRGASLVLNGILLLVVMALGGFVAGLAMLNVGISQSTFLLVSSGLSLASSVMIMVGWWWFTEPDPAFAGRVDASRSRSWLRGSAMANFGISVLSLVVLLVPVIPMAVQIVVSLLGYLVFGVVYFASLLYMRWLSPRVPNWKAWKRAKTMMWLGPVLAIPGSLVLIGPLIALIMYWNLLHWLRLDLKRLQKQHAAGRQAGGGRGAPAPG
jgi:hypothetical protein